MRRAPLVTAIIMCVTTLGVAQQPPARPAPRDPQRELAMSAADGFTVAAVGDCIIARPVSQTSGFAPVGKLVHDADVAFGNFEGTARRSICRAPRQRPRPNSAACGSSVRPR